VWVESRKSQQTKTGSSRRWNECPNSNNCRTYAQASYLSRMKTGGHTTNIGSWLPDCISFWPRKKRFETPTTFSSSLPKHFKIKTQLTPGVYEEIVQFDWCKEVFTTKFGLLASCHCHRWLDQIVVKRETPGVNGGFNNCLTVSAATQIYYARLISLFSLMIGWFWLVLKNTNIDWIRIENRHTWSIIFGGGWWWWVVVGVGGGSDIKLGCTIYWKNFAR